MPRAFSGGNGWLTKYVVVNAAGNWLDMADRYADAKACADRNPGTRVEAWRYPVMGDGTHGAPLKSKVNG